MERCFSTWLKVTLTRLTREQSQVLKAHGPIFAKMSVLGPAKTPTKSLIGSSTKLFKNRCQWRKKTWSWFTRAQRRLRWTVSTRLQSATFEKSTSVSWRRRWLTSWSSTKSITLIRRSNSATCFWMPTTSQSSTNCAIRSTSAWMTWVARSKTLSSFTLIKVRKDHATERSVWSSATSRLLRDRTTSIRRSRTSWTSNRNLLSSLKRSCGLSWSSWSRCTRAITKTWNKNSAKQKSSERSSVQRSSLSESSSSCFKKRRRESSKRMKHV